MALSIGPRVGEGGPGQLGQPGMKKVIVKGVEAVSRVGAIIEGNVRQFSQGHAHLVMVSCMGFTVRVPLAHQSCAGTAPIPHAGVQIINRHVDATEQLVVEVFVRDPTGGVYLRNVMLTEREKMLAGDLYDPL